MQFHYCLAFSNLKTLDVDNYSMVLVAYLEEWDHVVGHVPKCGDLLVADGRAQLRHHVDHVRRIVGKVKDAVLRLLPDQLDVQLAVDALDEPLLLRYEEPQDALLDLCEQRNGLLEVGRVLLQLLLEQVPERLVHDLLYLRLQGGGLLLWLQILIQFISYYVLVISYYWRAKLVNWSPPGQSFFD